MSAASARRRGAGRLVATSALLVLVLLGVGIGMVPSGGQAEGPSAGSVEPEGRRGLFLLLGTEVFGATPEIWSGAPLDLPSGPHLLVLPGAPPFPGRDAEAGFEPQPPLPDPAGDEEEEVAGAPRSPSRLRDPRHYRRFLESGGTILAPARFELREFLAEDLGLDALAALRFERQDYGRRREVLEVSLASGATVIPAVQRANTMEPRGEDDPFEVLARDEEGRDLVLRLPVGRGAVVLSGLEQALENDFLELGQNATLVARLLEELEPVDRVLFDEYALGAWSPPSAAGLALGGRPRTFTLHLVALTLLALWAAAGRRIFPRDPAPLVRRSALVRAEGAAGLYLASGDHGLLGQLLRRNALRRLAPSKRTAPLVGEASSTLDPEAVRRLLAGLPADAQPTGLSERLLRALTGPLVGSERELKALDAELAALDGELRALHPARSRDAS